MSDRRGGPRGGDRRHDGAERTRLATWRELRRLGDRVAHFATGETLRCPGTLAARAGTFDRPVVCGAPHGTAECPTTIRVLVSPYPIREPDAVHRATCFKCGTLLRFFARRHDAA